MEAKTQPTPQSAKTPRPSSKPAGTNAGTPDQSKSNSADSAASAEERRLQNYLDRARAGDRSVLPQLQQVLDNSPRLWREYMDLVTLSEQTWIRKLACGDALYEESLRRQLQEFKKNLAGPQPSTLELVLIDRIAAAWLAAAHAEQAESTGDDQNPQIARLRIQRLESANRRFLAASKTLAQVRRIASGLRIEIHSTPDLVAGAQATAEQPAADSAPRLRDFFAEATRENAVAVR